MKQTRRDSGAGLRTVRHPLVLAVASALAIFPLSAVAQTASQWGVSPTTEVNTTQINFGGHEWVVIGNKDKDIYKNEISSGYAISSGAYGGVEQPDDSVTLLSIKNDFASGNNVEFRAYTPGSGGCYGNYFAGSCKQYPNEYEGSDLQGQMANAVPSGREQGVINPRTLVPLTAAYISSYDALLVADGMTGAEAEKQLYWALSLPEWEAIASSLSDVNTNGAAVRSYPSSWWLRSPSMISTPSLASLVAASASSTSSSIRRSLSAPLSI
ncbi:hypothetical protein FACS1894185_0430 [Betaproteobacteria bacterium]|nr:hypothetical protein FACS1894185_0430 [Betaproteobacteria bacterium]